MTLLPLESRILQWHASLPWYSTSSAAGRNLREDNAAYYRVVGEAIHWMGLVIAKGFSWSEIAEVAFGHKTFYLPDWNIRRGEGGGAIDLSS